MPFPDDIEPQLNFGVDQEEMAPVIPITQPSAPQQLPFNQSIQAGYSGPTAAGHQRAIGMRGDIDRRVDAFAQRDVENTNQVLDAYGQTIQGQREAIGGLQDVHSDYERQLSEIDTRKRALFEEAARQEQMAAQEAKTLGAEYMTKYEEQLAAVRGMTVNISGPLSKLSTAQAGGLSLAMFAQGFLAAKGININVSGQIDRWVDRSIREQERQIQQAEQGAQDTLNLWNIARQNSQDDLEARTRYRGFIVEGLKAQTEFQAARFASRIASAQAKVSVAHLNTESIMTADQLRRQSEARILEQKKVERDTAVALEKVNLERRELAIREMAARAKTEKVVKRQILIDPSDGKAKWVVTEDRINASEDAKIATEAQQGYEAIDKQVKEAIEFRQKHAEDQWGHTKFADRVPLAKRQYEAMVESLSIVAGKTAFGLRATDKEAERIKRLIPFDKWYESGSNDSIWTKYRENVRSEFDSMMRAHADAIPDDQQFIPRHNVANPSARAVYEADVKGGKPVDKFAEYEQGNIVGKDSGDVGEHSYGSNLWKLFVTDKKSHIPEDEEAEKAGDIPRDRQPGDLKLKPGRVYQSGEGRAGTYARPGGLSDKDDANMPGYAVAIDHLVHGWVKPEQTKQFGDQNYLYYGTANETPEEIAQESEKALRKIASGKTDDGKVVPRVAKNYAKYLLLLGPDEILKKMDGKLDFSGIEPTTSNPKFK